MLGRILWGLLWAAFVVVQVRLGDLCLTLYLTEQERNGKG